ncbi:hypothetical protein A2U01_0028251 [Trifolium medium]|uniref:Uncharacterized protein n=1 Tax=Trifolium medium TaxID=97028 RepID=A0A392P7E2_9FABA|nr:hypothetical protein [Trifolium medium]
MLHRLPHNLQNVQTWLQDDKSSEASEFVDSTPAQTNCNRSDDMVQHSSASATPGSANPDSISTPVRVMQDMNFLRNSWANLADQEADELTSTDHDDIDREKELDPPDKEAIIEEPFQQVKSRKKGKKASAAQSKAYSTRSKVDNLNLAK